MSIDVQSPNNAYEYGDLVFQKVTFNNAARAIEIQNAIFPEEDASLHVLAVCDLALFRKTTGINIPAEKSSYYLAMVNDDIVGMTGLYTYSKTGRPNECWLAWYGVLDTFRGKGYGKKILEWSILKATEEGYDILRLHTSTKLYENAIKVYENAGFVGEPYTQEFSDILIYSLSLTGKPLEMIGERFLDFATEFEVFDITESKKKEIYDKYNQILGKSIFMTK